MHERIEECKQAEHSSKARQPVPTRHATQRRYRERDHDKPQGPIAESIEYGFDRICAKSACNLKCVADDKENGQQAGQEDDRFPDEPDLLQGVHERLEVAT